ncbi:hypothetical protein ACFU99_11155 [Streptomyces sp. NPDC057654]|uniref:hypothetical protein n=1 Tax=Streptomyces sp. NPDC057654 TaxID=3346196 RepID=UPI0036B0248F
MSWSAEWEFKGPEGPVPGSIEADDFLVLRYGIIKCAARAGGSTRMEREVLYLLNHLSRTTELTAATAKGGRWHKKAASGASWIAITCHVDLVKGGRK